MYAEARVFNDDADLIALFKARTGPCFMRINMYMVSVRNFPRFYVSAKAAALYPAKRLILVPS